MYICTRVVLIKCIKWIYFTVQGVSSKVLILLSTIKNRYLFLIDTHT